MEMARRSILALLVMGSLLAAAPSVAAAGASFHFSSKGLGAEGGWTATSGSGLNTVYTDTYIYASHDSFTEGGQTFNQPSIFVDQFSYKFDRRGNFVFVSERIGFASGPDVSITVDSKLRTASVSAVVPFDLCDERSCNPDGTSTVEGSWTATGAIVKINDNFKVNSHGFTETSHFRGSFRDAAATATIDGVDAGAQWLGDIFNTSSRDVFVCHHC
jgi:hypothetical protein